MQSLTFPEPGGRFYLGQLGVCQFGNVASVDLVIGTRSKLFKVQLLPLSERGQGVQAVADDFLVHAHLIAKRRFQKPFGL